MDPVRGTFRWLSGAVAIALIAGPALADDARLGQLESEMATMRAEIARLRASSNESWMNEQRTAEVKALIGEVLSDADTRASLQGDGMTAGHDGSHFFLASQDGKFLLELTGQMQFRYIHAFNETPDGFFDEEEDPDSDDDDGGFQIRRAKIGFSGHVTWGDRQWDYEMVLATERDEDFEEGFGGGDVFLEDFKIATALTDNISLSFGKYKLPFLREELTSSKRQLAVERALVTEFFTLDRSEQVEVIFDGGGFAARLSLNDGADEEYSTIGLDPVEFSVTGRVDVALAGSLGQGNDFNAWSNEDTAILLGGAFHYQTGDGFNGDNSSDADANYFGWTVDGSLEMHPLHVFGAFMGGHTDNDDDTGVTDRDMFGALVQGGFQVVPDVLEPFVRFEWLDWDSGDADLDDEGFFLTFGLNWFIDKRKHNSKLTADVVWVIDGFDEGFDSNEFGNDPGSDGVGFSEDDFGQDLADDNLLLRIQYQLLW